MPFALTCDAGWVEVTKFCANIGTIFEVRPIMIKFSCGMRKWKLLDGGLWRPQKQFTHFISRLLRFFFRHDPRDINLRGTSFHRSARGISDSLASKTVSANTKGFRGAISPHHLLIYRLLKFFLCLNSKFLAHLTSALWKNDLLHHAAAQYINGTPMLAVQKSHPRVYLITGSCRSTGAL